MVGEEDVLNIVILFYSKYNNFMKAFDISFRMAFSPGV